MTGNWSQVVVTSQLGKDASQKMIISLDRNAFVDTKMETWT